MLRGNATERVATSCIKAIAVIFTALEQFTKLSETMQEVLLFIFKKIVYSIASQISNTLTNQAIADELAFRYETILTENQQPPRKRNR